MSSQRPLSPPQTAALTEVTVQGADLLRGTVETLHRDGHSTVPLDLQDVRAADEAGLEVLHNVRQSLAAKGAELFVLASASGPTSRL